MSQKSSTIQLFKGIAIICVIMCHTCPSGMWTVICRPCLNICVPTFLFLSGYLTKIEGRDWSAFFKKRIIRVIIPYLIWTVLYTLQSGDYKSLPLNLLTTNAASHLYYIFVYIQFVLLTPILGKLAKSKYAHLMWLITPVYLIFYKYIPLFNGKEVGGYLHFVCWNLCLGWMTFYYLGLLLGNRILVKKYQITTLVVLYAAAVLLQMLETYGWLRLGSNNPGSVLKLTSIVTGVIFALIIYTVVEQGGLKNANRFLVTVGNYSFGLYLSHVLVIRLLKLTPFYDSLPYVVNSALVLLVSLGFCYAVDKAFGTKVSRWLGIK